MNVARCPSCGARMKRNGTTSAGNTRWRCASCGASIANHAGNSAKRLEESLGWLLSKRRQADMAGGQDLQEAHAGVLAHLAPAARHRRGVPRRLRGRHLPLAQGLRAHRQKRGARAGAVCGKKRELKRLQGPHGPHGASRGGGCRRGQRLPEGAKAAVAHHARAEVRLPRVRAGEALHDHEAKDPGRSRPLRACQEAPQGRGLGALGRMGRRLRQVVLRLRRVPERGDHERRGRSFLVHGRLAKARNSLAALARQQPTWTPAWLGAWGPFPPPAMRWRASTASPDIFSESAGGSRSRGVSRPSAGGAACTRSALCRQRRSSRRCPRTRASPRRWGG